ncbi:hypothetical protein SBV1_1560018 [Verrucomicrobia bacterium]|nr:hypothetical protein SBV1_1560018 [Verrucomicrobiota bacterium]
MQDKLAIGKLKEVVMRSNAPEASPVRAVGVPQHLRPKLVPIARRVFWWGEPEEWLDDSIRFGAQVMTYGDWEDTCTTLAILGDSLFRKVLNAAPPGVFDIKSWTYWHLHYQQQVPPLPTRTL